MCAFSQLYRLPFADILPHTIYTTRTTNDISVVYTLIIPYCGNDRVSQISAVYTLPLKLLRIKLVRIFISFPLYVFIMCQCEVQYPLVFGSLTTKTAIHVSIYHLCQSFMKSLAKYLLDGFMYIGNFIRFLRRRCGCTCIRNT